MLSVHLSALDVLYGESVSRCWLVGWLVTDGSNLRKGKERRVEVEGKWKGRGKEVAREREKDPEWSSAEILVLVE